MKTYSAKPTDIQRKWFIIDAADQVLGRLASKAANIICGKEKPIYTTSMDTGDYVVVINAEKVKVTGKKSEEIAYKRYSGYPDGLTIVSYKNMKAKKPEYIIEHAVAGMMPKNRLGREMFKKLKVYAGADHPHVSQKPEEIKL